MYKATDVSSHRFGVWEPPKFFEKTMDAEDSKGYAQRCGGADNAECATIAETTQLVKMLRDNVINPSFNVAVQRNNPNSPLYSIKKFEELNLAPKLLKGIYQMGFNVPSRIQESTLPVLLGDPPKNIIAQSQSGTGKSAAFILAMISRVNTKLNFPQVLCLSPTYELAIQTGEVAVTMAQYCEDVTFRYAVRGEILSRNEEIKEHIIIGTPGKVLDWSVKMGLFDLSKIKVFVLDEADIMISRQGHQDQCIRIHKHLNDACQMLLFSATFNKQVTEFALSITKQPYMIRLRRDQLPLDNIQQYKVRCANSAAKYRAIQQIYGCISIGQAIIFCATRNAAAWLGLKMTDDGHAVAVLSGDQTTEDRLNVIDSFREGKQKVLIATNVLSRGIDVTQVSIVINFDMPASTNGYVDFNAYLHRIGRTGRFGKYGIAINLIEDEDGEEICRKIEKYFHKPIKTLNIDDSDEVEQIGV